MTGPDALTAFYLTLEESPGDRVTLLALADWYDECGDDAAAACLRWAVEQGRAPYLFLRDAWTSRTGPAWHDGWFWWALDHERYGMDWGHSRECRLPERLWKLLRHTFDYQPSVFKEYDTARSAYEALLDAWKRGQPVTPAARRRRQPG